MFEGHSSKANRTYVEHEAMTVSALEGEAALRALLVWSNWFETGELVADHADIIAIGRGSRLLLKHREP